MTPPPFSILLTSLLLSFVADLLSVVLTTPVAGLGGDVEVVGSTEESREEQQDEERWDQQRRFFNHCSSYLKNNMTYIAWSKYTSKYNSHDLK